MASRLNSLLYKTSQKNRSMTRRGLFAVAAIIVIATGVIITINTLAATITQIDQTQGPTTGGQTVTITGTGFMQPAPTVSFDGQPATNVTIVNSTTITATTPAHAAGTVDVAVTMAGTTETLNQSYTFTPQIVSITPNVGTTAGGNTVTVNGSGFTNPDCPILNNTNYSCVEYLVFTGAQYINTGIDQLGDIKVDADFQLASIPSVSQGYHLYGARVSTTDSVFSFQATDGKWRTDYGTGATTDTLFTVTSPVIDTARHRIVQYNNKTYLDESLVHTFSTAAPATSRNIYLGATNNNGSPFSPNYFNGKIYSFSIEKSGVLTQNLIPVVNSTTGVYGMWDTVSGAFFGNSGTGSFTGGAVTSAPASVAVEIGGQSCGSVTVVSDTELTCVVPASNLATPHSEGPVDVDLSVNGIAADTLMDGYTYRAPMEVTSVSPASGLVAGGTNATLTGYNFIPAYASQYVQDGLVLHYDGIENVGTGTHNSSATTWTDLSPSGNNMNIVGSFTNNSFKITGVTTSLNDVPVPADTPVTVEYVVNRSQKANTTVGSARTGANVNKAYQLKLRQTGTNAYYQCAEVGNLGNIPETLDAIASYQFATSHSSASQTTCVGYKNGTQVGAASFASGIPYEFGKFSISEAVSAAYNLNIYAVRIYDRVLTPAELAKNAGLDSHRFNPATVTFDYGGVPAVCSNVVVVNNTTITCTTAAHTLGKVNVRVDNGVENAELAVGAAEDGTAGYRYLGAPTIAVTTTVGTEEIASGGTFHLAGTVADPNGNQPLQICATIGGVLKCATVNSSGAAGSANSWSLSWSATELGDGSFDFSATPLTIVVKNTTSNYGDLNGNGACDAGELCAVATWAGKVVVDTVPPALSVSPAGSSVWTNVQPSVTVAASVSSGTALVEIRYSWNNDLGADCRSGGAEILHSSTAGSEALSPALGETTLYACARDAAGNVATADGAYKWENIAPSELGVTWGPSEAPWNNGSAGVTFTLSGYSDTGGSGLASSNTYTCTTGTANGDTCTVTVYDNAGNYTVFTSPPNRVSAVGPQIDITNPADTSWSNSSSYWTNVSPTPQVDVTDSASGVTRIAYSWANDLDATCSNGTAIATGDVLGAPPQGSNMLYICAIDAAGNVTTTSANFNWETVAPTCTGWSPAVAPWNQGTGVTFMPTGCADTGGSGLVNPGTCTTTNVHGATCTVTVVDNAGNSVVLTSPPDNVDSVGPSFDFPSATGANFIETNTPLVAKILLTPNLAPIALWQYSLTPFPIDINTGNSVCTGGIDIDPTSFDFTQPFVIPNPVPAGGFKIYTCTMDQAGNEIFGEAEYNWQKPTPIAPPGSNGPDIPGVPNTGVSSASLILLCLIVVGPNLVTIITLKKTLAQKRHL